jgi:hypothetical protein
MVPIDFGAFEDPWQMPEGMTEAAMIHPTAAVKRRRMGTWTVLGPNTRLVDSDFGDYAYTARDCDIYNADVGKFCNIAAGVRINPVNHPMWRASQLVGLVEEKARDRATGFPRPQRRRFRCQI